MGWSDLPCDVVISIAAHLWEAGDYVRFRAVCRSWKSAVIGFRPSFFPWLAVVDYCKGDRRRPKGLSFISHVANNRVCKGHMPCDIVEYSRTNKDGLMISVHEDGVATIFNPVTGAGLHHLPSPLYTWFDSTGITDIILADNLSVFTVHSAEDDHLILAAATPGDDKWSATNLTLLHDFASIRDMVFHEADHKFYVLNWEAKLLSFRLTRCGGKTIVGEVSTLSKGKGDSSWFGAQLVSYGSNLLLVIGTPSRKENFEILKYCPDADTWIGMIDIDLGNNSLFIDSYGAKLLPLPQGEEGRLRRNCIYFIDYEKISPPDGEERKHTYLNNVRIYDMSKGILEPCLSMSDVQSVQLYSMYMWFTPSLSINN